MAANQWVNTSRVPYASPAPTIQVKHDANTYRPKTQHTIDYTVFIKENIFLNNANKPYKNGHFIYRDKIILFEIFIVGKWKLKKW